MSVIKIENLTFSYYGYVKLVFENISFSFDTNWKTGLIGRNGVGKSTLFKLLLNQEVYQGKISKSVDFIKFPPNIIDTSKLGIELYKELVSDEEEWKLFRELNLLSVDDNLVYREFEKLSKGEQTKILLAILFTKEAGFLLIDEPTNHLDMDGRKIVSEYLKGKKGFLLISHDRDFLDGCINHVISINRNSIDVQSGNFTSWYENKVLKDQFEINQNEKLKKDIKRLKESARQSQIWSNKIENTKNGVKVPRGEKAKGGIRQSVSQNDEEIKEFRE